MKTNNKDLVKMLDELKTLPRLYRPSQTWQDLNVFHNEQLSRYGLNNLKRSVNRTYFNWGVFGFFLQHLPFTFSEIIRGNLRPIINSKYLEKGSASKKYNELEIGGKYIYGVFVAYLYDFVSRIDKLKLLKKISEPSFGSPVLVGYRERSISQDLCNSIHEFYSITKEIDLNKKSEIAEIGAGYGRLAYVFLETLPKANYCIIDIPPALYVAQEYLRKIFPREKFFFFRHFDNFKKVEKDFREARIKFLMPHQVKYLPKDFFNIIINISSLHEMRTDQIIDYIKQADRLCSGYVYLKQWRQAKRKDNNFIRENEYPIPGEWRKIYHHKHPIQNMFFEALYKTRSKKL